MYPETFAAELTTRLGPAYRLRRAIAAPRWCVEQKVKRGDWLAPPMGDPDQQVRAREGYHLVIDSPDHDTIRCPECAAPIALIPFQRTEFECEACLTRGLRTRVKESYFPLVDRTLTYLESTAPRRGRASDNEMEARNRAVTAAMTRDSRNLAEDLALDAWGRIAGIPQYAYNSRVGTPNVFGRD